LTWVGAGHYAKRYRAQPYPTHKSLGSLTRCEAIFLSPSITELVEAENSRWLGWFVTIP